VNDPIIGEVHKARVQLWERCGKDWNTLSKCLEQRSVQHPEQMVTRDELDRIRTANAVAAVKAKGA
jgi:hypothetical protein